MESKTRKALSWSLSVLVHVALLFFIIRAGIQYALPEGEVISGQSIDVVENSTPGAQVQAAAANRETPTSAAHKTSAPKSTTTDGSGAVNVPEEPQPHFIPDKAPQDVVPEDKTPEQTQDENPPQAIPETKTENVETSDEQKAPEVPVTQEEEKPQPTASQTLPEKKEASDEPQKSEEMKPVQEADNAAAQSAPTQSPAVGAQTQTETPTQAPNQGQTQQAPGKDASKGTGPEGPMLDETKLTEMPGNEKPSYPWVSKLRRQEGTVILRAFITKDGHVDLPILAQSSGFPTLDQECIRAYSHWKYKPGLSGWVLKPFRFILKK